MSFSRRSAVLSAVGSVTLAPLALVSTASATESTNSLEARTDFLNSLIDTRRMNMIEAMPAQERVSVLLVEQILAAHPDVLDVSRWMTSSQGEIDGVQVKAVARRYETRWRLVDCEAWDQKVRAEPNRADIDEIAAKLAGELREAKAEAAAKGLKIIPYRPIVASGLLLDASDFTPVVTFFSQFGLVPA